MQYNSSPINKMAASLQIATIINTHGDKVDSTIDAIESVKTYVGDKVLLLVEGSSWDNYIEINDVMKVRGFNHTGKSPYRNMALGLSLCIDQWLDEIDWICYSEYDTLFASDRFAASLKAASEMDVWMMGVNGHVDEQPMPLVSSMLDSPLTNCYYLLGCCLFFHRGFMKKLIEINFFERFLNLTNGFKTGHFPFYDGYDISEHMYPSLCRHFGGNIGVLSSWDQGKWHGSYEIFPIRWTPDLDPEKDPYKKASILHPIKSFEHSIRKYHRQKRNNGI